MGQSAQRHARDARQRVAAPTRRPRGYAPAWVLPADGAARGRVAAMLADAEAPAGGALREGLETHFRQARAVERARSAVARIRSWLAAEGWHEIEVDDAMRIRQATRSGLALLGDAVAACGLRTGMALPPELVAWLRRSGLTALAPAARTVVRQRCQFTLRGLPAFDGDGWLLYVRERATVTAAVGPAPLPAVLPLSPREREVLAWVAAGKTDAQAAAILGISVRTVQKHLENSYVKLGVEGRTAAVMRVRAAGNPPCR